MLRTVIEEDKKIWRYLKLWKFESILKEKSLFFAKASEMDDIEEGLLPESSNRMIEFHAKNESFGSKLLNKHWHQSRYREEWKEYVLMSCWRKDDSESSRAWCEYVKSGCGVAIQSTYNRFIKCFREKGHEVFTDVVRQFLEDDSSIDLKNATRQFLEGDPSMPYEVYAGIVRQFYEDCSFHELHCNPSPPPKNIFIESVGYRDTEPTMVPEGEWARLYHYIRKDPRFKWENELRALTVWDSKIDGKGILVSVDLEILIEKVIVSPKIPEFYSEVKSIIAKHGLKIDVCKSSLNGY